MLRCKYAATLLLSSTVASSCCPLLYALPGSLQTLQHYGPGLTGCHILAATCLRLSRQLMLTQALHSLTADPQSALRVHAR
jgi:hypothetical protein